MRLRSWLTLVFLSLPAVGLAQDSTVLSQEGDTLQVAAADSVVTDTVQRELVRAQEATRRLAIIGDTIQIMLASMQGAGGEERELIRMQVLRYVDEMDGLIEELVDLVPELDSANVAADSVRTELGSFLTLIFDLYARSLDEYASRLSVLREQRSHTPIDELGELLIDIHEAEGRLLTILAGQMRTLTAAGQIGVDVGDVWDDLDRFLITQMQSQVGRLQMADVDRDRFRAQLRDAERIGSSESEIAALRSRLQIAARRVASLVMGIRASSDLLDQRGIETAQYRRAVIEATGEVTGDVLNPQVLAGVLRDVAAGLWSWVGERGPTLLVRLLIVIGIIVLFRVAFRVGWWSARKSGRMKLPRLMSDMIGRLLRPLATIIGLAVALWFLGVDHTTLVAGLGVAGIIVGLALQDSMSNLAAGFFILIYRPYDVEDVVNAGGVIGRVKEMGLANTTIVTFDNRRLFVPNRKIWSEIIENRSVERIRRVETTAKIGYHEDLNRVFNILKDTIRQHEQILHEPEPSVFISDMADSWIEINIWVWVANEHWWSLTTDLPRVVRLRFEAEGVEVPYPRQVEEHITKQS